MTSVAASATKHVDEISCRQSAVLAWVWAAAVTRATPSDKPGMKPARSGLSPGEVMAPYGADPGTTWNLGTGSIPIIQDGSLNRSAFATHVFDSTSSHETIRDHQTNGISKMSKLTLVLIGSALTLAAVELSPRLLAAPPTMASPQPYQFPSLDESIRAYRAFGVLAAEEQMAAMSAGGTEMGSAGFHVTRPQGTPHDLNMYSSTLFRTPRHMFWWADCLPTMSYPYMSSESYSAPSGGLTPVALRRAFSNALISTAFTVNDSTSTQVSFSVYVTFDPLSITRLQRLVGTTNYNSPYHDWYYVRRKLGELPTPMSVALVAENYVYRPISITDLVASSTPNQPVLVASGLDPLLAVELVTRLGF